MKLKLSIIAALLIAFCSTTVSYGGSKFKIASPPTRPDPQSKSLQSAQRI